MKELTAVLIVRAIYGGIIGLVPFLLGKYMGKRGLGELGAICCVLSALLFVWLPPVAAVGFAVVILLKQEDYHRFKDSGVSQGYYDGEAQWRRKKYGSGDGRHRTSASGYEAKPDGGNSRNPGLGNGLSVSCLSGPLRGRIYPVGQEGLMIGREASCGIRFPDGSPGISVRHCQLRWQQGVLMLSDLGSTYGTFLGDGRKLPPDYPMQLAAGSRFYLANVNCLFQIIAS